MTTEIRHVINHRRFPWSFDDLILPGLELLALIYLGSNGYDKLTGPNPLSENIDGLVYLIASVAGIALSLRRLLQLNSFVVLETPLDQEGNFLFCLDRVKMFNIQTREFDRWNFCVGVKAHGNLNPLDFWLTCICYENKIYLNERPSLSLLSLWWNRYGVDSMVKQIKALQAGGKEMAEAEVRRIQDELAQREEARATGQGSVSTDPWEESLVLDPNAPAFYSRSAILGFSVFFSPVAGTLLLAANISDRRNRWKVIGWGLLYSVVAFYLLHLLPGGFYSITSQITFFVNATAGSLIANGLWSIYMDKNQKFRSRPIWKPLALALCITALVFGVLLK